MWMVCVLRLVMTHHGSLGRMSPMRISLDLLYGAELARTCSKLWVWTWALQPFLKLSLWWCRQPAQRHQELSFPLLTPCSSMRPRQLRPPRQLRHRRPQLSLLLALQLHHLQFHRQPRQLRCLLRQQAPKQWTPKLLQLRTSCHPQWMQQQKQQQQHHSSPLLSATGVSTCSSCELHATPRRCLRVWWRPSMVRS